MIAWKIVNKNRRSLSLHGNSKYCRTYEKDSIVKAAPKTLGLFCFKTEEAAEEYKALYTISTWLIIQVDSGSSRGKKPKLVSDKLSDPWLDAFYSVPVKNRNGTDICYYFHDVICFPKVKVLT